MEMKLYTNNSSNNTINKELSNELVLDIKFKNTSSVINPVVILQSDVPITSNYAYIPKFGRYYYISDVVVFPNKIYSLNLEVDVLESYKEDILNSKGYIVRQTNINKYYDSDYECEVKKEIDVYKSDKSIDLNKTSNILLTVGTTTTNTTTNGGV